MSFKFAPLPAVALATVLLSSQASAVIEVYENNRYFQQSGQPVFLLGHYHWASAVDGTYIDSPTTYRRIVDDAVEHGLNYIRLHLSMNRFTSNTYPPVFAGGPTPSPFIYENGKANLDQWDESFWTGLEDTIEYARSHNIMVHVGIFEGVSLRPYGWEHFRWVGSHWNISNQTRSFFGNIDYNGNGSADDLGEFYQNWGFNNPSQYGYNSQRLGYYQRRMIAKTVAVVDRFDNVFYQIGNELHGPDATWNQSVVTYFKTLTNKPVAINHGISDESMPANGDGLSRHHPSNNAQDVKRTIPELIGRGYPSWMDPDGGNLMQGRPDDNRRAAWYSLTGGAAGWGGFNQYYVLNNEGLAELLDDYSHLSDFIAQHQFPFWDMRPANQSISNAGENNLLALSGQYYLAYVLNDGSITISLPAGTYDRVIFDPLTGATLVSQQIQGDGSTGFSRPAGGSEEWVVYLKNASLQPNSPPEISITSPANGASFTPADTIVFEAAATDLDGQVTQVEYYAGGTLFATETVAPYAFSIANVPVGNYQIVAKVYDDDGDVAESDPIGISVVTAAALEVAISQPANNSEFTSQTTIEFQASVSNAAGSVSKVEYYAGGTLFATVTQAPYTYAVANVPVGSYSITAKAYDSQGNATSQSISINVTEAANQAPSVNLLQPLNNSTYTTASSIPFQVEVSDPDGSIAKVEYYAGDYRFATVTSAPFSLDLAGAPAGNYDISALVFDDQGVTTRSSVVSITVTENQ